MKFKKEKKVELKIFFDRETQDIRIEVRPPSIRPTEVIQVLMYAIGTINKTLQAELSEKKKKIEKKNLRYIN